MKTYCKKNNTKTALRIWGPVAFRVALEQDMGISSLFQGQGRPKPWTASSCKSQRKVMGSTVLQLWASTIKTIHSTSSVKSQLSGFHFYTLTLSQKIKNAHNYHQLISIERTEYILVYCRKQSNMCNYLGVYKELPWRKQIVFHSLVSPANHCLNSVTWGMWDNENSKYIEIVNFFSFLLF